MTEAIKSQSAARQEGARAHRARISRVAVETVIVCAASLAVVCVAVGGTWVSFTAALHDDYARGLVSLAQAAAAQVDVAAHERIRGPSQLNGADYDAAVEPLRRIRQSVPFVKYIYTARRVGDEIRFVLDAADPGDHDGDGVNDQSGVDEVYEDADPAMLLAFDKDQKPGVALATEQPYSDAWGTFMSGYAPLLATDGTQVGVVGVDVDARVYVTQLASARRTALLGLLPATLMLAGLGWLFYRIRQRGFQAERDAAASARRAAMAVESLALEKQRVDHSEKRLRTMFELSPVAMALADFRTGRFVEVNDMQLTQTGYSREEFLNLRVSDLTVASESSTAMTREIIAHSGKFGPLEVEQRRKDGSTYPVLISGLRIEDERNGDVIWAIAQDISSRKSMEESLTRAASTDRLTGLANRARLVELLREATRRIDSGKQQWLAVLFLDFDRFKLLNDTLGHDAGDELLRQISERLRRALRASDTGLQSAVGNTVARLGGDEFVLLLNDMTSRDDAVTVAERLLNILSTPYVIKGITVHSTASVGIVICDAPGASPDALLRDADVAMYEAKRAGRGRAVVFNETMQKRLARQVTVEASLREALGSDQLWLAYQPIVDLETGRMVTAEALVRWRHPVLGELSPAEFVPAAEDSGLILPLGEWVLEAACKQFMEWRRQNPEQAPQMISVNVARAQLALGEAFVDCVSQILERVGLPAACLQLEITESDAMRDPAKARAVMQSLRSLGVRMAVDDFGTGTSSLSCLREYPFDMVKIDRSFLTHLESGPDALAVLHATVALVENLQLTSVAEGVENISQVVALQSLGCDYGQGYYFGRPESGDRLIESASHQRQEMTSRIMEKSG